MRNNSDFLFASESVSEGHPDKVADRISDAVLDTYLAADPEARVACETLVTTNQIILAGEVRGPESITKELLIEKARETVKEIGYDQEGFSWRNASALNLLHAQSAHIAMGVDSGEGKDEGAGDQGIMFGYATTETDSLMPAPIYYAHKILQNLNDLRKSSEPKGKGFLPDAKSQVTLQYVNGKPVGATSIVLSTQHEEAMKQSDIRETLHELITNTLPEGWMCPEEELYVNPTGLFIIGGPDGDCGLTGRKIIVDTYGGAAPHGGGAFSGKDPTKVDRSAAYACRYLAKNIVSAGLADSCTLQISYAIGVSHPLSVYVDLHNSGKDINEEKLEKVLREVMDLSPRGIRKHLRLNRPIYRETAAYGHFGRTPDLKKDNFTWEQTDLVDTLRSAFNR